MRKKNLKENFVEIWKIFVKRLEDFRENLADFLCFSSDFGRSFGGSSSGLGGGLGWSCCFTSSLASLLRVCR